MKPTEGGGEHVAGPGPSLDVLFGALAHADRRHVLGRLADRAPGALTVRDLATYLAPAYPDRIHEDGAEGEFRASIAALHHGHLPQLEAAGLIVRDGETVSIADHPAFEDAGITAVIGNDEPATAESLDALFRALATRRRRTVLVLLSHQFGPIHAETLARELGAGELGVAESAVPADTVEERLVSLRNIDLPRLVEAGMVEHDAGADTVAYLGHPELRVPWMHSVLMPRFRPSLTGESTPQELGTIHGRERVVSFGQSLCDRADEELFCMFTDTDLLEAGCLTRIRDASRERGVKVYLGTPNPTIREYIREHAPEVVLWEPKSNWLNLPVAGNRVGRLLLADREAVMLGTLDEETDADGFRGEKSIIGEGADNTLVVMVTQLLSAYLDQIDAGAEDLEATHPF